MRARFAPSLLLVAIVMAPLGAFAQTSELCLILRPEDGDLVSRLAGQTADLDWEIREVELAGEGEASDSSYARIQRLAEPTGARVAIWFEVITDASVRVYIADLRSQGLFARQVQAADESEASRSAMLESIALIVRSSLIAIGEGEEIGFTTLPPVSPGPPPEAAPASEPEPEPPPPSEPESHPRWAASATYQLTFDGESEPAQHGPSLRASLGVGVRYWVDAALVVGLPVEMNDALTEISLSRHRAAVGFAAEAFRAGPMVLVAGLDVGAVVYRRSTEGADAGVLPTADKNLWSAVVAPFLRLQVLWPAGTLRIGVDLGAALDVVPTAPDLSYQQGMTTLSRNELRVLQPAIWMGIVVTSR